MSVADKYMFQVNRKNFKFIPPEFNKNLFRNNANMTREEIISNNQQVEEIVLSPTENNEEQLYCYYNEISNCYKGDVEIKRENMFEKNEKIKVEIPLPSEILRNFDLELNEEIDFEDNRIKDEVESIYSRIESSNPNVLDVLLDYKIPTPVAKLIAKRIVQLSLKYRAREQS
eukprot:TRINITY_DN224_c0_g5_i1.p1 TRINITY_DN224_c0_g5~~TRINITY_DN224_c0_g5_i1.p1  ORF type:complete len:201 (+),score=37.92 TRINITY_DN224_c0_g5_i1:89-604(+)